MSWTHRVIPLSDPAARAAWQPLWSVSEQRSVFTSLDYALCVQESLGIPGEALLISSEAGEVAAGIIAFTRRQGPYTRAVVPPFTPYNSPVFRTPTPDAEVNQRRSAFEYLLECLEERYDEVRIQLHLSLQDVRPAVWRGWTVRPYFTYAAALSPGQDPLAAWSRRTRRTAKSEQPLFAVREDGGSAAAVAEVYAASLHRQKHQLPVSQTALARHFERLNAAGLARLFTVSAAEVGAPTGGLALLHDGREAHYWVGGSAPGSSMTVLLGSLLPALAAEGVTSFDYDGANTPSIAEFKRQFGGRLVPYFGIEKVLRPELRILGAARRLYAGLRTPR